MTVARQPGRAVALLSEFLFLASILATRYAEKLWPPNDPLVQRFAVLWERARLLVALGLATPGLEQTFKVCDERKDPVLRKWMDALYISRAWQNNADNPTILWNVGINPYQIGLGFNATFMSGLYVEVNILCLHIEVWIGG